LLQTPDVSSSNSNIWLRGESKIRKSQKEAANIKRYNAIKAEDFEFTSIIRLYINNKKV